MYCRGADKFVIVEGLGCCYIQIFSLKIQCIAILDRKKWGGFSPPTPLSTRCTVVFDMIHSLVHSKACNG